MEECVYSLALKYILLHLNSVAGQAIVGGTRARHQQRQEKTRCRGEEEEEQAKASAKDAATGEEEVTDTTSGTTTRTSSTGTLKAKTTSQHKFRPFITLSASRSLHSVHSSARIETYSISWLVRDRTPTWSTIRRTATASRISIRKQWTEWGDGCL